VIGQRDWGRKESFEGRLLDGFGRGTLVARIQVFIEESTEVDFVEGILVGFLIRNFGFGRWRRGGWFGGRFNGREGGAVVIKPGIRFRSIGGDSRLNGGGAIYGFENGLIGRLGGALRFENGLHFLGRQLFDAIERFLEHRVLGDFLRDHVLQLEAVQLKDRHHLDESRSQDLLLRDFQLQSGRKHRHSVIIITPGCDGYRGLIITAMASSPSYLSIYFVNIYVRDQERSVRFYVDQLGFDLAFDARLQGGRRWVAVAPPDGSTVLSLIQPERDSAEYKLIGRATQVVLVTEDATAT